MATQTANLELFINGKLCDIAKNFSVRINRLILKPEELNTKDAQFSFSVSLPATVRNNTILGYTNKEEVRGKFTTEYDAELSVNSVRVFSGKWRPSEISDTVYKGNLYLPEPKTVKDIFGAAKMADAPPYEIGFQDFAAYLNYYNNLARAGQTPPVIFPYVLYGLLPKVSTSLDGTAYSAREVWDESVRLGLNDFPPSINVLNILKHIFASRGYAISGTAFDDPRLSKIYMSYSNPADYVQAWNYGRQGAMDFTVKWSNLINKRSNAVYVEGGGYLNTVSGRPLYTVDMLDSTNGSLTVRKDTGGNIINTRASDANGQDYLRAQIRIPTAGYYKVLMKSSLEIYRDSQLYNYAATNPYSGTQVVSAASTNNRDSLQTLPFEVKLLRDNNRGDFGVGNTVFDAQMYYNNMPQNSIFDGSNAPKYFPFFYKPDGFVTLVDMAQNANLVAGANFGYMFNNGGLHPLQPSAPLKNPQILFAKPSLSWDNALNGNGVPRLVTNIAGYQKYGYDANGNLGWTPTLKYNDFLTNAPYANTAAVPIEWIANFQSSAVVWFEAGELLTVAGVSNEGRNRPNNTSSRYGWVAHEWQTDISITPFRTDKEWAKINAYGDTEPIYAHNWNDPSNFNFDTIDIVKFLPSTVGIDDFLDNFCKAFNLNLSQVSSTVFSLDVKQKKETVSNVAVNMDGIMSVRERLNTPLNLPSLYKLGFTIDTDEEGWVETLDDGGGSFETGSIENKVIEQKSSFSFNWFKSINKTQEGGQPVTLQLPIISKKEAWDTSISYPDAMGKRYTSQPIRFWYFDGLLTDGGASFDFKGAPLQPARVSNVLTGRAELSYRNAPRTILTNYFTLLIDGASHYTEGEAYLTAEQYEKLNGAYSVEFNNDSYYIAEVSGYDPTAQNKTKLKLIRKI